MKEKDIQISQEMIGEFKLTIDKVTYTENNLKIFFKNKIDYNKVKEALGRCAYHADRSNKNHRSFSIAFSKENSTIVFKSEIEQVVDVLQ